MRCFSALLALLVTLPAVAHDLWLERKGPELILLQGHKHSAHGGADTLPYPENFVHTAQCLGHDGALKTLPHTASAPWRTRAECTTLQLSVSSGYWTKTPWETKNAPKNGVAGVLKSWLSEESLKHIEQWTPGAAQAIGHGLEITPLANPLLLKPGDKLTVRITENRQSKPGVPVAYGDDVRGATGEDGSIAIRIRHGGVQLITTSLETPLADGKADLRIQTATLQFDLPQ